MARTIALVAVGSDGSSALIERGSDTEAFGERVDAEFEVAASKVLHEGVTADHDAGGAVALKPAHRSLPRFQPSVIALDPVVRVHSCVMLGVGEQVLDGPDHRRHLHRRDR